MNQIDEYRVRFRISPAQARILEILSAGEFVSSWALYDAVCKPRDNVNTISAHMYRLRRKIAPIEITSLYGSGYCLNDRNLKALRGQT